MALALSEINAGGGVNGRKLKVISRDDGANPGTAVRVAEELVAGDRVHILAGGYLSNVGLAIANFAGGKHIFYLAGEPLTDKIVWQDGNKYTFRLRPSTYMLTAMLVPEAATQRGDGELLLRAQNGKDSTQDVSDAGRGQSRRVRLHRTLLQSAATPLDHRLSQPGRVRKTGDVSLGWCPPNRGQATQVLMPDRLC